MKPTRELPPGYRITGSFDLKGLGRVLLLNVLGLVLLAAAGWLFTRALYLLRPAEVAQGLALSFSLADVETLLLLLWFLALYAAMLVVHEAFHGIFFWIFTRQRPVFAFKIYYAYAAAPGWFLPRNPYLVTALAPLAGISLGVLAVFAFGPPQAFLPALVVGALNASGAVADVWVAVWLLFLPPTCLANDRGDAITLYCPG